MSTPPGLFGSRTTRQKFSKARTSRRGERGPGPSRPARSCSAEGARASASSAYLHPAIRAAAASAPAAGWRQGSWRARRSASACGRVRPGGDRRPRRRLRFRSERADGSEGPLPLRRSTSVSARPGSILTPPTPGSAFLRPAIGRPVEERAYRARTDPREHLDKAAAFYEKGSRERRGRRTGTGVPTSERGTILARRVPHPPDDAADVEREIIGREGALSAKAGSNRRGPKQTERSREALP